MGSSIPGLGSLLGGQQNPQALAGANTYDVMTPDGMGMDVMGSIRAHGNAGTAYVRNAGSNPISGPSRF